MSPDPSPEDRLSRAISEQERALEIFVSPDPRRRAGTILPEHRRVLGEIHETLGELRRLRLLKPGGPPFGAQSIDRPLVQLIEGRDVTTLGIAAAWEYVLCVKRLLLTIGDRHYIRAQLENEWQSENSPRGHFQGSWSDYFDKSLLEKLRAAYAAPDGVTEDGATHRQAVEYLTYLSLTRNAIGRSHVMNSDNRAIYIWRLRNILAVLLAVLLLVTYFASYGFGALSFYNPFAALSDGSLRLTFGRADFHYAVLAGALGALGSALAGFYKLRDEVKHLNQLRAFAPAMYTQPLVGATAGILLFLIIRSGLTGLVVKPDGIPWAYAVYGFLAGFSEPFFLGIINRVATTANEKINPPTAPPPAPGTPSGGGGALGGGENPRRGELPPGVTSPPDEDFIASPSDEDFFTSPPGGNDLTSPPDDDEGFTSP